MIIFVEGPDGSGKSTLVKSLSNKYITATISRKEESFEIWDKLTGFAYVDNAHLVVDRSPLTEYVYRNEEFCTPKFNLDQLLELLKGHGHKLIYCRSDTAYEDAIKRGENNIVDKDRHAKIQNLYDVFIKALILEGVTVMYYNWRYDSVDDVIAFIEEGGVKK